MRLSFSAYPMLLAGVAALLLQACSGPHEDPRIALCRNLAADLTDSDADQWRSAGNRFVRPEYAAVSVAAEGQRDVTCYYAYDAVEEGAMEHAEPLLAYATLPFKVVADGRALTGRPLTQLVSEQQIESAREAVEQAQQQLERASDEVKKVLQ